MIEQGTDAWRLQRCGLATASRFADVMATVKTGESADRRNYRAQLIVRATYRKPVENVQQPRHAGRHRTRTGCRALYQGPRGGDWLTKPGLSVSKAWPLAHRLTA